MDRRRRSWARVLLAGPLVVLLLGVIGGSAAPAGAADAPGIPDVAARKGTSATFVGNNVYSPAAQSTTQRVLAGSSAGWVLAAQNDAAVGNTARMVTKGCRGGGNFRVRYSFMGVDMTSLYTTGFESSIGGNGSAPPSVDNGVYVSIKVKAGTPVGARFSCAFRLRDVETGDKDTIELVVVRRA